VFGPAPVGHVAFPIRPFHVQGQLGDVHDVAVRGQRASGSRSTPLRQRILGLGKGTFKGTRVQFQGTQEDGRLMADIENRLFK